MSNNLVTCTLMHPGAVVVRNPLDREVAMQHNLTVMVNDQGMNPYQNFTRVTINVVDHNDHAPQFLTALFRCRVFETAAVGTSVIQVLAIDQDKGHNAEVTYSIVSGMYEVCFKKYILKIIREFYQ